MIRSTDYLRRIIAPVLGDKDEVTMVVFVSELQQFPSWKTTSGWSLGDKGATIGGARSVERSTIGSNQTSFWSNKQVTVSIKPRSS